MIGELLVTVEKQQGATSQTISDIEKKFATGSPDEPKRIIEQAANSLAKSQKRLGNLDSPCLMSHANCEQMLL